MKNRGISPLIATVLLVGFVIVMSVFIWLWYGEVIQGEAEKQRERIVGEYSCVADVEISVSDVNCILNENSDDFINFNIQNKGQADVSGFRVIITASETETKGLTQSLAKSGAINTGVEFEFNVIGQPSNIEIMPILSTGVSTTTCDKQSVILTIPECV